jgi:glycosyltransferase involved in cell wall biosynthesis
MKFLHLINVRWYNATAWYAVNLSRLLKDEGHEVIVAGLPGTPPVLKAKEYGLETFEATFNSSNPVKILRVIKSVNKLIKDFEPNFINCHRGEFFWYFAFLRCFSSNKFKLIRIRGDIRPPSSDFFNKMLHKKCTDKIIVSGDVIKKYFENDLNIASNKISVVYGGVNTNHFKPDEYGRKRLRNEFGFDSNDFVVGIVGRFDFVQLILYVLLQNQFYPQFLPHNHLNQNQIHF